MVSKISTLAIFSALLCAQVSVVLCDDQTTIKRAARPAAATAVVRAQQVADEYELYEEEIEELEEEIEELEELIEEIIEEELEAEEYFE
jgi:hypothetical protein